MSQPVSRYLHPFDVAGHPTLEPEVKRAILASWAFYRSARTPQPARRAVPIDEILSALRLLADPRQREDLQ